MISAEGVTTTLQRTTHQARRLLEQARASLTWEGYAYLILVLLALGLRLWQLHGRAIHYDEALHIYYSYQLAEGRGYSHNPLMHGPLQFHLNALVFLIFGDNDYTARLVYALAGTALVAVPYFLRDYLGRAGALVVAAMLAVSPSLLYFSRFGRNDILIALFALALVALIWRYLQEGRRRHLYLASAVLALAFSTKETAWMLSVVLGAFLFLLAIPDLVPWVLGRVRISQFDRPASLLVLLVTLALPQWSALTSLVQEPLGLVLVTPQSAGGPVGLPQDCKSLYVSFGILAFTMGLSAVAGVMWRGREWLKCAGIFYSIYVLLYTTFFTNPVGLHPGGCVYPGGFYTGIWQSLGYWLAQQEVARGGQPWYYYLATGFTYEFLPLLVGVPAAFYFLRKGDLFGLFLVYWAFITLLAYTVASEKMPWLLVNVALPFVVLSGAFLGRLVEGVRWRRVLPRVRARFMALDEQNGRRRAMILVFGGAQGLLLLLAPALLAVGIWLLKDYLEAGNLDPLRLKVLLGVTLALLAATLLMMYRFRSVHGPALAALGVAGLMLGFTFFVAARASYTYDDRPIEMLNYAQGSIDVRRVAQKVRQEVTQADPNGRIMTDYEIWFPFQWYVRGDTNIDWRCVKDRSEDGWVSWCNPITETPTAKAVLLNAHHSRRDEAYLTQYDKEGPYRNLLWFPEVYRVPSERREDSVMTQLSKEFSYVKENISRRQAWRGFVDYFLSRKLGSQWWYSDFYAYMPKDGS